MLSSAVGLDRHYHTFASDQSQSEGSFSPQPNALPRTVESPIGKISFGHKVLRCACRYSLAVAQTTIATVGAWIALASAAPSIPSLSEKGNSIVVLSLNLGGLPYTLHLIKKTIRDLIVACQAGNRPVMAVSALKIAEQVAITGFILSNLVFRSQSAEESDEQYDSAIPWVKPGTVILNVYSLLVYGASVLLSCKAIKVFAKHRETHAVLEAYHLEDHEELYNAALIRFAVDKDTHAVAKHLLKVIKTLPAADRAHVLSEMVNHFAENMDTQLMFNFVGQLGVLALGDLSFGIEKIWNPSMFPINMMHFVIAAACSAKYVYTAVRQAKTRDKFKKSVIRAFDQRLIEGGGDEHFKEDVASVTDHVSQCGDDSLLDIDDGDPPQGESALHERRFSKFDGPFDSKTFDPKAAWPTTYQK